MNQMNHTSSFAGASASAVDQGAAASTRSVMVSQKPIVGYRPERGGERCQWQKGWAGCAETGLCFSEYNRATLELSQKSGKRKPSGLPIAFVRLARSLAGPGSG